MDNELAIPAAASPSELSPEQKETAELLLTLLGKAIADRYVDLCALSAGTMGLRVSRPVAAHALRELESLLRTILASPTDADANVTPEERQLQNQAISHLRKLGYNDSVLTQVRTALTPRVTHKALIRSILARLDLPTDGDVARLWFDITDINKRVHQRSFHDSLVVDDEFRRDYVDPFHALIRELAMALKRRYATLVFRCAEIADMEPSSGVNAFLAEVPGAFQLQAYFYNTLESKAWLPVLESRGLLKEPLLLTEDEQAGVRFRQWPVSRYLLRMASSDDSATRKLVVAAIRSLKGTNHPDVASAIIDIIARLPPAEARDLIDVVVDLLARETGIFPHAVPNVIKRLAEGGECESALLIVEPLFRIFERNGALASRFEASMFEHYLADIVTPLSEAAPVQSIAVFCQMLLRTSTIDRRFGDSDFTANYASEIGNSTTSVFEIPGAVVSAIVKCGEAAIGADSSLTRDVVASMLDLQPKIFRRVALHLISLSPSSAPELADRLLTDPSLIDAYWCRDEYARLAVAAFPNLVGESQSVILNFVESVPQAHEEGWKERFAERFERAPTSAEHREYQLTTVRDLYWSWCSVLPAETKAAFDATVAEFGGRDDWKERLTQPRRSPLTTAEMQEQPVEETISFLSSAASQGTSDNEGLAEGLASNLRAAVSASPVLFASQADKFVYLTPIFLQHLFEGLLNAAVDSRLQSWDKVLLLIERLAERSPIGIKVSAGSDHPPHWASMCRAAAELLSTGLRVAESSMAPEHEPRIQNLVIWLHSTLTNAKITTRFAENVYFAARSTDRGLVVELCVSFIFWCSRNDGKRSTPLARGTLGRMENIQQVLDSELADRSPNGRIPRAIIGRHLKWFFYFGEDWLRQSIVDLFQPAITYLRNAAWGAHLEADAGPIAELFDELSPFYGAEIARLTRDMGSEKRRRAQRRLAEYLLVLRAWRDTADSHLRSFYESASPDVRKHAMWFLAHALMSTEDNGAVAIRAREVWAMRLQEALASAQPDTFREELGVIGTWFSMGVDVDWLLPQVLALLKGGFMPTNTFAISDKLAARADLDIDLAITVLKELVSFPRHERWEISSSIGNIRTLLLRARASSSPLTAKSVDEIISLLASTGDGDLLDLHSDQR
ncbi:hypothetical protein ACC666_19305 [Rhizobium johnstonii]